MNFIIIKMDLKYYYEVLSRKVNQNVIRHNFEIIFQNNNYL